MSSSVSSASAYQQSDTSERGGFIVDAVSDDVGKGVFATRDFVAGETIFRERPLVSAQVQKITLHQETEIVVVTVWIHPVTRL